MRIFFFSVVNFCIKSKLVGSMRVWVAVMCGVVGVCVCVSMKDEKASPEEEYLNLSLSHVVWQLRGDFFFLFHLFVQCYF